MSSNKDRKRCAEGASASGFTRPTHLRSAVRLDSEYEDLLEELSASSGLPEPEVRPAERSDQIFTLYETLHDIIQRHEATIQRRWSKKTR